MGTLATTRGARRFGHVHDDQAGGAGGDVGDVSLEGKASCLSAGVRPAEQHRTPRIGDVENGKTRETIRHERRRATNAHAPRVVQIAARAHAHEAPARVASIDTQPLLPLRAVEVAISRVDALVAHAGLLQHLQLHGIQLVRIGGIGPEVPTAQERGVVHVAAMHRVDHVAVPREVDAARRSRVAGNRMTQFLREVHHLAGIARVDHPEGVTAVKQLLIAAAIADLVGVQVGVATGQLLQSDERRGEISSREPFRWRRAACSKQRRECQ